MKKYLIVKKSKRHSVDEVTIEKENVQEVRTNIGIINISNNQLGKKAPKPKFKNNSNKVFMKRRKR